MILCGILAEPAMLAVLGLSGDAVMIDGHLRGGARSGLARQGWPTLAPGGQTAAVRVVPNLAVARYAAVMGLTPRDTAQGPVLGLGCGGADGPWHRDLAVEIARQLLAAPALTPPDLLAARLPMIGTWASSRLRAMNGPGSGAPVVAPRGADDVQWHACKTTYQGFFTAQEWQLSHRFHNGKMGPVVKREAFISGDAVVILPWDPVRDRVLVIEQFRVIPALRGDPQPWQIEAIAGRIDAGETPEQAGIREAREEAALTIRDLIPAAHVYASPGTVTEYLYQFVGITDLPDDATGVYGLESEAEDIRGHLLNRRDLSDMLAAGQVSNGPLALLSLWLDANHARLRG
ncbi:NUDIX domain-containing protein [Paracoccus sp. (in: a-proteobacteria)]|uniref:NUDIX domain-containing protein n=1 Tax=Paracoccus sp. TaxID=267 RepID=UPI0026E05F17|nr:NUDIX domain-containing protein [Paracoccus sp. (in: a-proteobacteria)]MDO5648435.1 NUDIX domain-containing protein [Paracoccus sp. (in: a-proteobacteria)]